MRLTFLTIGFFLWPQLILSEEDEEIWVAVEDRIEVFSGLTHSRTIKVLGARHVISMVADPSSGKIFLTELGSRGRPSVYMIREDGEQVLLAKDNTTTYFPDLTYDPTDGVLYLTSKEQKTIYSLDVQGASSPLIKTYSKDGGAPRGIDLDKCSRYIYWTNVGTKSPSFEVLVTKDQSPSDGTSKNEFLLSHSLISGNLTRPGAVSVDQAGRAVFWTETHRGTASLYRTDMRDGETGVMCSLGAQEPAYLQVTDQHIYWTDWRTHSLLRVPKEGDCRMERVHQFRSARPYGLTWVRNKTVTCGQTTEENQILKHTIDSSEAGEETHSEEIDEYNEPEECSNICLSGGICHLGPLNLPICDCPEGYTGERCQENVCTNYCLQTGSSCKVLEGEPQCLCAEGFHGERCNVMKESLQTMEPKIDTEDAEGNSAKILQEKNVSTFSLPDSAIPILLILLVSTCIVLFLLVLVLCVCVCRMKNRPRVKRKRFISVQKGDIVKKQGQDCGVSIDIEDCCNMTLCDTPCFDPPTRGPRKQSRGRKSERKVGDKSSLLDYEDEDE